MKRLVIGIAISAMCLGSIAGCGGSNTSGSATTAAGVDISTEAASVAETKKDETEESTTAAETVAANYEVPFTMADIDWHVEEGIDAGERRYVFYYTNNTPCDIISISLDYAKKPDVTDDQMLDVFGEYSEKNDGIFTDEEIVNSTMYANNYRYTQSGSTADQVPLYITAGWKPITGDQYSLFDLDIATIEYVDGDKIYVAYYDFKNDKLTCDKDLTTDKYEWSDNPLAQLVPKPEYAIVQITWDRDDGTAFNFEICGTSIDDYNNYREQCLANGIFNVDVDSDDDSYEATNADGVNFDLYYSDTENRIVCRIDT